MLFFALIQVLLLCNSNQSLYKVCALNVVLILRVVHVDLNEHKVYLGLLVVGVSQRTFLGEPHKIHDVNVGEIIEAKKICVDVFQIGIGLLQQFY